MAAKEKAMSKIRKKLGEASTMGVPGMLNVLTEEDEPYVAPLPTQQHQPPHLPSLPSAHLLRDKIFGPVSISNDGEISQSPVVVTARQCL